MSNSRRRLLRSLGAVGVTIMAVPQRWVQPVVESVLLPAHAQTIEDSADTDNSSSPCADISAPCAELAFSELEIVTACLPLANYVIFTIDESGCCPNLVITLSATDPSVGSATIYIVATAGNIATIDKVDSFPVDYIALAVNGGGTAGCGLSAWSAGGVHTFTILGSGGVNSYAASVSASFSDNSTAVINAMTFTRV